MASQADIDTVRFNTSEQPKEESAYSDEYIGGLVDNYGVDVASATIWHQKASDYAELVDVSEAGSSHKFSDLHKNALTMARSYLDKEKAAEELILGRPRARVVKIVRQ